jgi:uncharacterized membrane protein
MDKLKKAERILSIAGGMLLIAAICFGALFVSAVIFTIRGDRSDAAFCLLWGITIDMLSTLYRNLMVERYNNELDRKEKEDGL